MKLQDKHENINVTSDGEEIKVHIPIDTFEVMMTKRQIIDEKSRGAFSDPNKERVLRLNLLADWLVLYNRVEKLERECCQLHAEIRELESEAKS